MTDGFFHALPFKRLGRELDSKGMAATPDKAVARRQKNEAFIVGEGDMADSLHGGTSERLQLWGKCGPTRLINEMEKALMG